MTRMKRIHQFLKANSKPQLGSGPGMQEFAPMLGDSMPNSRALSSILYRFDPDAGVGAGTDSSGRRSELRHDLNHHVLRALNHSHGNQRVNRIIQQHRAYYSQSDRAPFETASPVQTKLSLGAPGDRHEQEADQAAERVAARLQVPAQRGQDDPVRIGGGGPISEPIQTTAIAPGLESQLTQARGGGRPLPDRTRESMEQAFGEDFRDVRIYTDRNSRDLNETFQSRAFTLGSEIHFGSGELSPETPRGQRLLAHELAHVAQQKGAGGASRQGQGVIRRALKGTAAQLRLDAGVPSGKAKVKGAFGFKSSYTRIVEALQGYEAEETRVMNGAVPHRVEFYLDKLQNITTLIDRWFQSNQQDEAGLLKRSDIARGGVLGDLRETVLQEISTVTARGGPDVQTSRSQRDLGDDRETASARVPTFPELAISPDQQRLPPPPSHPPPQLQLAAKQAPSEPPPKPKPLTLQPGSDPSSLIYMEPAVKRVAPRREGPRPTSGGIKYAELDFDAMRNLQAQRAMAPPLPPRSVDNTKAAEFYFAERLEQVEGELDLANNRLAEAKRQLDASREGGEAWTKNRKFFDEGGRMVSPEDFLSHQIETFERQIRVKTFEKIGIHDERKAFRRANRQRQT